MIESKSPVAAPRRSLVWGGVIVLIVALLVMAATLGGAVSTVGAKELSFGCQELNNPVWTLQFPYDSGTFFNGDYYAGETIVARAIGDGTGTMFTLEAPPGNVVASTNGPGTMTYTFGSDTTVAVRWQGLDGNTSWNISCSAATPKKSPGLWAAHVCAPYGGFDINDWLTLGSDGNSSPYGSTLQVAPSIDGPWTATGFLQSPYIISRSQVEALTEMVGLTDYLELWMRVGDGGKPARLGSMIQDRDHIMDELCGIE